MRFTHVDSSSRFAKSRNRPSAVRSRSDSNNVIQLPAQLNLTPSPFGEGVLEEYETVGGHSDLMRLIGEVSVVSVVTDLQIDLFSKSFGLRSISAVILPAFYLFAVLYLFYFFRSRNSVPSPSVPV